MQDCVQAPALVPVAPNTPVVTGQFHVLRAVVCIVLQDGTLLDELDRLAVEGRQLSSRQVLELFRQVWLNDHRRNCCMHCTRLHPA